MPNDSENYYRLRDLVPPDLIGQLGRAKILITNFHAFKPRKLIEANKLTKEILGTDFVETPRRWSTASVGNSAASGTSS